MEHLEPGREAAHERELGGGRWWAVGELLRSDASSFPLASLGGCRARITAGRVSRHPTSRGLSRCGPESKKKGRPKKKIHSKKLWGMYQYLGPAMAQHLPSG